MNDTQMSVLGMTRGEAKRARKAEEVRVHNAEYEARKALTVECVPEPVVAKPARTPGRYGMTPLDLQTTVAIAVVYKAINESARFRGIVYRGVGLRAQARARGFSNMKDRVAEQQRAEYNRMLAAQARETAQS